MNTQPPARRPGREQRLLAAALKLMTRFGFDKTTIAEIAREAGMSKGAVYLHFKSKERLFEALLKREMLLFHDDWLARVEDDPGGGTIAGMYRNLLHAIHASTLVSAIFRQDVRVLGTYLHNPDGMFRKRSHHTRQQFVELMQAAGAIRPDLDPQVTAHIMNMLSYGLVAMGDIMPAEDIPDMDRLIEGISDLMDRALSPPDGGDPEAGKKILRQLSEAARQRHEL